MNIDYLSSRRRKQIQKELKRQPNKAVNKDYSRKECALKSVVRKRRKSRKRRKHPR